MANFEPDSEIERLTGQSLTGLHTDMLTHPSVGFHFILGAYLEITSIRLFGFRTLQFSID